MIVSKNFLYQNSISQIFENGIRCTQMYLPTVKILTKLIRLIEQGFAETVCGLCAKSPTGVKWLVKNEFAFSTGRNTSFYSEFNTNFKIYNSFF